MQDREPIPTPGHALVGLQPMYRDFEGAFYIPRNARSAQMTGRIGFVCAITPWPQGQLSWVYEAGQLVARHAWRHNHHYQEMLNKYALCRQAVLLWGVLYSVRLEHLEAIVPEEARADEDVLGRCRRCKAPEGELGVLLGPDGYCPVCGYNRFNEHQSEEVVDVSEYEIDQFVRKPAEVAHFLKTGGKAVTDRLYSFPGQTKRSAPEVAMDDELDDFMRHLRGK